MPNYISNRLTIKAADGLTHRIMNEIAGTESAIDFDKIVPMPDVLKNTGKGSANIDGQRVNAWWTDNDRNYFDLERRPDRLLTAEEKTAIAETGFSDWYDWSVTNWGTKWNASTTKRAGDSINFETAWSVPLPVIAALSTRYPQARFTLRYADEDIGNNAGTYVFKGGKLVSETSLTDAFAAALYFELNPGRDPKERGYDPETFEFIGEDAA